MWAAYGHLAWNCRSILAWKFSASNIGRWAHSTSVPASEKRQRGHLNSSGGVRPVTTELSRTRTHVHIYIHLQILLIPPGPTMQWRCAILKMHIVWTVFMVTFVPEDHTNPLMPEHPENPKYFWYSSGMSTCTLHAPLVRDTVTIPGQYQDDHVHSSPPCQSVSESRDTFPSCSWNSTRDEHMYTTLPCHAVYPEIPRLSLDSTRISTCSPLLLPICQSILWSLFTVTILDQYWNEHMHTAPPLPFLAKYPKILKDSEYSARSIMHTPP